MFPFSFTARPSKDKEEETLIQEAKATPQAKAESKPGETSWFSPATFLPPVTQGLGVPSAPSGPVSWSDELALPCAQSSSLLLPLRSLPDVAAGPRACTAPSVLSSHRVGKAWRGG